MWFPANILSHERVTGQLVVADVRTQLHKGLRRLRQTLKVLIALDVDLEFLSGIHGKAVDNHLAEEAVVDVGLPRRFQRAITMTLSEIAVSDATAGVENQAHRHNEDRGKGIKQPHVDPAKRADEHVVHPSATIGCACPLFLSHRSIRLSCAQCSRKSRLMFRRRPSPRA